MARYLCAEGAGQDLRRALFSYNYAEWYVSEIVQLAARYGGIASTGGGLINGWADRPALNQYDRDNYTSDQSWLTWRAVDCSAAALDWLLGAYGRRLASLDDAIALIGPNTGISTILGLTDARGPGLVQALTRAGLHARSCVLPGIRTGGTRVRNWHWRPWLRITGNSYSWNGGKRTVSSARIVRWFR